MMEILRAEVLGFCFGVRRAIELAEAALRGGSKIDTLGPLVHNPQETARLAAEGIRAVDVPERIEGSSVVIRAHGARPETFRELEERGLRIIDATCPFVNKSQGIAREFERKGYTLVIIGHPDHPEVQGILGYATGPAYVIAHPEEVTASLPKDIRPGIIAQTTVNEQTFQEVLAAIAARYPNYLAHNTVCSATRARQQSARELATQVDALYVVGGKDSSNANRLAEICRDVCANTYFIETAEEINPADLHGIARVGVTAGASTPDWLIEQVITRLHEIDDALTGI